MLAAGTVLLVIVGSIGPWARVAGMKHEGTEVAFSVNGTGGDGLVTLVLGGVAGLLILWRLARPKTTGFVLGGALLGLLVVAVMAGGNWLFVDDTRGTDRVFLFTKHVSVGWGLVLTTLAGWAGVFCAGFQLWQDELR